MAELADPTELRKMVARVGTAASHSLVVRILPQAVEAELLAGPAKLEALVGEVLVVQPALEMRADILQLKEMAEQEMETKDLAAVGVGLLRQ
jgi:hypothetical protein